MTRIAIIVGSLREGSLNRLLAKRIAEKLEGAAQVSWLAYADLPLMNQDLERPAPPAVARVRAEVATADGLWFVCPEYNGGYPGHVKNLVDWLSRPQDPADRESPAIITGAKVTISGAGGASATRHMQARLIRLLDIVGCKVLSEPTVGIALTPEALGAASLPLSTEVEEAIDKQVAGFLAFVEEMPGELECVAC